MLLLLDLRFIAPIARISCASTNTKLRARFSIKQANAILLLQMAIEAWRLGRGVAS